MQLVLTFGDLLWIIIVSLFFILAMMVGIVFLILYLCHLGQSRKPKKKKKVADEVDVIYFDDTEKEKF